MIQDAAPAAAAVLREVVAAAVSLGSPADRDFLSPPSVGAVARG